MIRRLPAIFVALLLALVCAPFARAQAHFIDGYLADCSAVTATTCTELTVVGYARQPVYFGAATRGVVKLGNSYSFAQSVVGTIAGRGVYDAPTGGNLLFVMPFVTPLALPSIGDRGDAGSIVITLTALVPYQFGETYIGTAASAAIIGTTADGLNVTAGHSLTFLRGLLMPGTLAPT